VALALIASVAHAQSPVPPTPIAPAPPVQAVIAVPVTAPLVLQAGTEVPMKTLAEVSSKLNRQGDRFDLVVSEDVLVQGHVVIPRGSRGVGEITKLVPKGAFGKSGKLEARLLYVAVGNSRIRLDGRTGDRGKSGTGATVATAVLAGVFSAFVTGTSAVIPAQSTMIGFVERDMPLELKPAPAGSMSPGVSSDSRR
jgi:hypothetical protein